MAPMHWREGSKFVSIECGVLFAAADLTLMMLKSYATNCLYLLMVCYSLFSEERNVFILFFFFFLFFFLLFFFFFFFFFFSSLYV